MPLRRGPTFFEILFLFFFVIRIFLFLESDSKKYFQKWGMKGDLEKCPSAIGKNFLNLIYENIFKVQL